MQETQTDLLLDIESFMKDVISRKYSWKYFKGDYNHLLDEVEDVFDIDYKYSPLVQAFWDLDKNRWGLDDNPVFTSKKQFCEFQQDIRIKHQDYLAEIRSNNARNQRSLERYFRFLVDQHRKLLIVRVDLSYCREVDVSVEKFKGDITKLIERVKNKDRMFNEQVGYVYRLEQGGSSKGYHCHLAVIYNGSIHFRDGYLGEQIGVLWRDNITEGDGLYFNCNQAQHKKMYQRLNCSGIGMIERNDSRQVSNAFVALSYLADPDKQNQYLRAKIKGMREFSKGQLPITKRDRNRTR